MDKSLNYIDPDAIVVSKTVQISAPASLVWKILLDMKNYNKWNPFCVECESTLEMGAAVNMKLKSYVNCKPSHFNNTEYICEIIPEEKISWQLPHYEAWPYPARRDQFIQKLGTNKSSYYSTDQFLGPNGIHVMRFAGPWVKQAFDDTADALKVYAENLYKPN
jgi:uncharacterized protein YndB with AHSA1/START domain